MEAIAKYLPDNKKKMVAVSVEQDKIGLILGKISPGAIWVKDGDKIEIKLEREWKYSKWTKNFIAKVKCPNCKFYH